MKKLATALLSSAVIGGLTLTAFVPTASADDSYRGMQRGNFQNQQMQQGQGMGQGTGNGMMMAQRPMGPQGQGQGMGPGIGIGDGLLRLACSANGAPRLEISLNNLSERLTLDADQTTLFDAFKTSALTAQTSYADACQLPDVAANTAPNPVEALKLFEVNATARIAAIDAVLPSLEAFYNSLTDEQKAQLTVPNHQGMRVGQFDQGQGFGPGRFDNRGMGPGQNMQPGQGFGPGNGQGQGQGFGPGQGQGFGQNMQPGLNG